MTEYQIQPNTRRCAVTGRPLQPGEKYFSVLLEDAGKWLRQDFCREAWTGPPAGAFSFWTGKVPEGEENPRPRFDDDLLLDCFLRLEGQAEPQKLNFRYILALLLLRRKKLRFEQRVVENGQDKMILQDVRAGTTYQVVNPRLTEEEMLLVQDEVFALLGWG